MRHFGHVLSIYKVKIPPSLIYACETDISEWEMFDVIEGTILRRICNLNSLANISELRLEFGLTSA